MLKYLSLPWYRWCWSLWSWWRWLQWLHNDYSVDCQKIIMGILFMCLMIKMIVTDDGDSGYHLKSSYLHGTTASRKSTSLRASSFLSKKKSSPSEKQNNSQLNVSQSCIRATMNKIFTRRSRAFSLNIAKSNFKLMFWNVEKEAIFIFGTSHNLYEINPFSL